MDSKQNAELANSIAQLKDRWPNLNVVERAQAVKDIHCQGASDRDLAKELPCSSTTIRNLRKIAEAPEEDQDLARKNKIGMRELMRRAKVAEEVSKKEEIEDLALKKDQLAQKECKRICAWIEAEQLWSVHGECIIEEARRILAEAEWNDQLPKTSLPLPKGMPIEKIIQLLKPLRTVDPDVGDPWGMQTGWSLGPSMSFPIPIYTCAHLASP